MFRIGEFSKIAQVSSRLLRYYDEIGLLRPSHIDRWTNYRYYTADQLLRLNRILALKELGLSLDEIQQLLEDDVGTAQIRDLYQTRKEQIERSLREELARLQQVQLRLNQLESLNSDVAPDVVVKEVPEQQVISFHGPTISGERFFDLFERLCGIAHKKNGRGPLFTVMYSPLFTPEADMDLEIGFIWHGKRPAPLIVDDEVTLNSRQLPAVSEMATIVHQGLDDHPLAYNGLGRWLGENHYQIIGPGREILLENRYPADPSSCVMEIQFPIKRLDFDQLDLLLNEPSAG